jgi:penicillin amidase
VRWFWRGVLVVLGIVLVSLIAGVLYLRASLPRVTGTLTLTGLQGEVSVVRDQYGVAHIEASSDQDAYFALGFVHAQERLWQMEFQRRVGAGRLAEVVGEGALETDRFLRTLGVYQAAEASLPFITEASRQTLQSYVAGINAFLKENRRPLPPEFLFFRHTPEPWQEADVLVWSKMMAWDLSGNWSSEVLRARLLQSLSPEQVAELWPPYPGDAPVALPDFSALYRELPLEALQAAAPPPLPAGAGSNNWVVSGEYTASGAPLLANDPHLGLSAPSLWYFAHLCAPGLSVIGATLPGTPAVLLGRNNHIAWGFTNSGTDVQDMFIERLNPDNPDEYETPAGFEPFAVRQELLRVRGGDDVRLTVRESRHGPIISDVSLPAREAAQLGANETNGAYVLAFAWTALMDDDTTVDAILGLNRAQNWDDFTRSLRHFVVPQQSIVYADGDGNVGFYAPGRVPIRASGDGLVPVPGWTDDYAWTSFIPFEELPHAFNPASGQIVTANHKLVPEDYPYLLTYSWAEPYRARRIEALLAETDAHSVESFQAIQRDQKSLMAQEFLPFFLAVQPESQRAAELQARLQDWDGEMLQGSLEPLIFYNWYRELFRLIFADELGRYFETFAGFRPLLMQAVLTGETTTNWCNDTRTAVAESCDTLMVRALELAAEALTASHGQNVDNWRWGEPVGARHAHAVFSGTPLSRFFDLAIANGGDAFTVNVGSFRMYSDFGQHHGPGFRAVYDLADLNNSGFIHATGQSGNPFSSRYRDYLTPWRDGELVPMTTDETIYRQNARVLTLRPGAQ